MTTVAEKYLQIAKLAKDPANAEVVIDGILTFFGLDYFDLDLGVEYLYTTKVIDYKFRSVLHKAEDMDAIMAWFKEKAGVTDEEIAAAEAKEKEYVAGCLMLNNIWVWATASAVKPIWSWLPLKVPRKQSHS